jgi:hypothetical protein
MRRSKILSYAGAPLVLAALLVASSTPASAADVTASATCNASSTTNVTLYVGERLTITTSGLCTRILGADGGLGGTGTLTYVDGGITRTYPIGTGGTPGLDNPSTVIYTGTVVGGARVEIRDSGGGGVIQSWVVTVVAAPSPSTAQSPAPILQQFGAPTSGTCADAAPARLNWAGVSSGGWGLSWSQWMNNGMGGVVCGRTLVYQSSSSAWTIA